MKNNCQINVKMDCDTRDGIIALAHTHDMSASEYLRELAINILHEKLDELSILQEWATRTGNESNKGNDQ